MVRKSQNLVNVVCEQPLIHMVQIRDFLIERFAKIPFHNLFAINPIDDFL